MITNRSFNKVLSSFGLMAIGVCLLTPQSAPAADVVSTWDNTDNNWSDASHWDSADFPNNGNGGLTYDAVIAFGTVTLGQDITIEALTQSGGAITGDFDLDVNVASTWSGGNQGGAGTTTFHAPVTITELHNLQDTRTINNAVSATFHSTNSRFINAAVGATFNNLAGATFAIDGNSDYVGAGTFNNAGTFNKSAGAEGDGITQIVAFNNSSVVNINSGELRLNGDANHSGDFNVASGGLLNFASGTHNINAGMTIDGDGTTNFGSNNVMFNTASFELDTLATQTGGTIFGDGTLNFNKAFTWTGGNQSGDGISNFNAPVTITELHNLQENRTINNVVSTTFHSTNNRFINAAAGTTFNNLAGATFSIEGNSDYAGAGTFNNAGTFNKSAGAEGDGITQIVAFNNSNVVNINSGELLLSNNGTHTGDFNVATGGTLRFAGTHEINNGTTIDGDGTTVFGGSINFNTATFELDTLATQTGGTIDGDGTLNFNKAFTWTGGNQSGDGISNFNAPVTITELHNLQENRTINNVVSTTFHSTNSRFINAAAGTAFNNLAGATFSIEGNSDYAGAGTFNNAGTFNKTAGDAGDDITVVTATFSNSGTLNVTGGEVRLSGPFTSYDAGADTLLEGTYNVAGTLRFTNADINTNQASITLDGPGSQIIDNVLADALLDFATNDTGAFFGVVGNRDFTTTAATFTNRGQVQLGGGMFTAPILSNAAGGEIFGFGTIVPRPTNAGTIRAAGGTLTVPLGIQGGSGTVQIDSGATLNLSAAALGSNADMLIHNGTSLNLGANSFSVGVDYQNANFGVGNSFNARANVTGSGQINASPGVTQSLGGDVTNGGSATATMAFGNVHVGDAPTRNYQINNAGASGPSLRGAIQTNVGGANLSDSRLTGAGVTASNFGPIATGAGSGNLPVTFNATTAGPLSGQQVRIVNNFDNVAEQTLQITGAAYRYASPSSHTPEPVDFGIIHVGDTVSQALSITNDVPNDGFSERLNASIGSPTGDATTNSGSFTSLDPGATNNTSLSVGVDTATAGSKTGTATITLASNGTGTSSLGNTSLDDQIVNIQAQVNNFAAAGVVKVAGDGTVAMSGANQFTLDLGLVALGDDTSTELGVANIAAAPADSLAGSFTPAASDFLLSGFGPFGALGAGDTRDGLVIEFDAIALGMFTGQITLQPQSTNSQPFSLDLTPVTINLAANVILAGDYNDDGIVGAADYVVWRNNNGQNVTLPGDPTPGSVTQADYDVWAENFGNTASGSGAAVENIVPEPATAVIILLASLAVLARRRRPQITKPLGCHC